MLSEVKEGKARRERAHRNRNEELGRRRVVSSSSNELFWTTTHSSSVPQHSYHSAQHRFGRGRFAILDADATLSAVVLFSGQCECN